MSEEELLEILLIITDVCPYSGRTWDRDKGDYNAVSRERRAANLMNHGYAHLEDPFGWSAGAKATLLLEGNGECVPPFNGYYNHSFWEDLHDVNEHLRLRGLDFIIEVVNASVLCIH